MDWRHDQDDAMANAVYSPGMVGALAGVSGQSIGQWARNNLIQPSVYEGRPVNRYSYYDVAEALVVRWMLDEGIAHKDIRAALDGVRDDYPRWPLLQGPIEVGRLSVDDRALLVKREEDTETYIDATGRDHGQFLIKPALLGRAGDMLAHGGWLAAAHKLKRIEVEPAKMGGVPTLKGRRWTVDQVARLAADDRGRELLVTDYELQDEEVDEARTWFDAAHDLVLA